MARTVARACDSPDFDERLHLENSVRRPLPYVRAREGKVFIRISDSLRGGRVMMRAETDSMSKPPAAILIVEDEGVIALDIRHTLERLGYRVCGVAARGGEAIEKARSLRPGLVLMDVHLQGAVDGIEAAAEIQRRLRIPVIYLTAYADAATVARARLTEPFGYVLKPFEEKELHVAIEMALYRHEMDRRLEESERWLAATLKSIGESVIATDADWRIRFMNPAAELLTGWESSHAAGRDLADVVRVSIPFKPRAVETGDLPGGGGVARGVLVTRDGKEVSVEERSTLIRDEDGAVIGIVIALRDLGEKIRKVRGT